MNIELPIIADATVNEQTPTQIESRTLPPAYSQLSLNKEEVVISQQPTSTKNLQNNSISLSDISLNGYKRNNYSTKNPYFLSTSDDNMVFTDSVNYRLASLCIKPMVKIANQDKVISKINLTNISSLPLKEVRLSPDNQKLLLFFKKDNNRQLYLVENSNSQQKLTENANFNKVTKLSCPLKQLTSIEFDVNGNIFALGVKNNSLLEVYKLSSKDNINWSLDLQLTIDGIYDAQFSQNRLYLYTLSHENIFKDKQNILGIYSRNNNFKLVAEVENTTSFPEDIDSACETLIFIDNETLTLKSLVDNSAVSATLSNELTFATLSKELTLARFIPDTKDILLFRSIEQVGLLKKSQVDLLKCNADKELSYYIKETNMLDIEVKNAYFNANDKNNLRVITSNSNEDGIASIYPYIGMCFCGVGNVVPFIAANSQIYKAIGCTAFYSVVSLSDLASSLLGLYFGEVAKDIYGINNTKKIDYQIKDSDTEVE